MWFLADPYSSAWFRFGVWENPCLTLTGVNSSWDRNDYGQNKQNNDFALRNKENSVDIRSRI